MADLLCQIMIHISNAIIGINYPRTAKTTKDKSEKSESNWDSVKPGDKC